MATKPINTNIVAIFRVVNFKKNETIVSTIKTPNKVKKEIAILDVSAPTNIPKARHTADSTIGL